MNYKRAYNLHKVYGSKLPEEMVWFIDYCLKLRFEMVDGDYYFYKNDDFLVMKQVLNSKWFLVRYDVISYDFPNKHQLQKYGNEELIKIVVENTYKIKIGTPINKFTILR